MSQIPQELQEKLKKLREKYLDHEDQQTLDDIEKQLRKKILASKLRENDMVKVIIEDGLKRIDEIGYLLAQDEDLTSEQRSKLFQERKAHRFWLGRFGYDAETFINSVGRYADEKLK